MSNLGIFTHHERYLQTIKTIDSIRTYAPNCAITLIDSSADSIEQYENLIKSQVDEFINNSNNEVVQKIISTVNESAAKSVVETYVLANLLKNWNTRASRIYKISGRYCLTDKFNVTEQDPDTESFIFKDKWGNNWPEGWCDIPHQYPTYGFSFPANQQLFMIDVFEKSHELILEHVNTGRYCDIEHALYKFIPEEKVKLININAVEGLLAQNGQNT
jgi:hypothetical protein